MFVRRDRTSETTWPCSIPGMLVGFNRPLVQFTRIQSSIRSARYVSGRTKYGFLCLFATELTSTTANLQNVGGCSQHEYEV